MELLTHIPNDCAYADCGEKVIRAGLNRCPACLRSIVRCSSCQAGNRSFAVFCRSCGQALKEKGHNWPCSRGGVQRLSVSTSPVHALPPNLEPVPTGQFKLPGRCRYILEDHGYLFAFSLDGGVIVMDTRRPNVPPFHFQLDGHIFSDPVIHRGTLYTGTGIPHENKGKITAYSLTGVPDIRPRIEKCWSIDTDGIPTRSLTLFKDRLYFQLVFKDSSREIFAAHRPGLRGIPQIDRVYRGFQIGNFTADPASGKLFFFSVHRSGLHLNTISHPSNGSGKPSNGSGKPSNGSGKPSNGSGSPSNGSGNPSNGNGIPSNGSGNPSNGSGNPSNGNGHINNNINGNTNGNTSGNIKTIGKNGGKNLPEMHTVPVQDAPADISEHLSPAAVDGKLIAVFRGGSRMGCIDIRHNRLERWMFDNVKQFSAASLNSMVIIDASGVFFPVTNHRDRFIPGENTMCPPIIMDNKIAVMGMQDGKLRFYHLNNPSIQSEYRVFDSTGDPITAMAVSKHLIAAGNQRGFVKILKIIKSQPKESVKSANSVVPTTTRKEK